MKRIRGIALPFILLVITLMLVILTTVATQGIGSLHQSKVAQRGKTSAFAAEAGAADALRLLVEDPNYPGPLAATTMATGSRYSATVINHIAGGGPSTAPNGAVVPTGFAYILATGTDGNGNHPRQVGVLVRPGSATALGVGMGAGGSIRLQGSKTVRGTIKANGDIRLQGNTRIEPLNGQGRLLASGSIQVGGNASMDEAQDARARGSISGNISGAFLVQPNDTTDSTAPFINDYRTTNSTAPSETGNVLPNPDVAAMTAAPNYRLRSEVTWSGPFDLNGEIHHFPNGIDFASNVNFTGSGTILVTGGNSLSFQGSTTIDANLIVLRDAAQYPSGGDPSIRFQGNSTVTGLVYAHQDVRCQGNCTVNGVMIAYQGDLRTQGSTDITLDSTVLANVPGFEPWSSGFGGSGGIPAGSGPLTVVSWERL